MGKRKNHYHSLGIDPDATPEQIKRAYRAKARVTHPDKGGDAEEFAAVADAYEVLGDPQRKLLYDASGQDRQKSIEDEVQEILLGLFSSALQEDLPTDIVTTIRNHIKAGGERMHVQAKTFEARRRKLEKRRAKIKSTAVVNLAHMVIDGELKNIDQALVQFDHQAAIQKALLKAIDAYSEEVEKPTRHGYQATFSIDDMMFTAGGPR
ncbi:MAG: J domain-containing protein [Pyrinomonadaceae bacterium]